MFNRRTFVVVASILSCVSCIDLAVSQEGEFQLQRSADGVAVAQAGKPVLFVQTKTKSLDGKWPRANYVHPLYSLDGQVLTEDFPQDHRHHRGVYWSWHQLRWKGKQMADPWICQGVQWLPPETGDGIELAANDRQAVIQVTRDWAVQATGNDAPPLRLVRERMELVTHAVAKDVRRIDIILKLRALRHEVAIGGSEDVKGYGGFSTRLRLPDDLRFLAQTGLIEPKKAAVEGGAWVDLTATYDGQPAGVAVLCHTSNPGFPTKWILRAKNSMQNAAWPGREPVTLPVERDLVLRYRLLVHRGRLTAEAIDAAWKRYTAKGESDS